MTEFRLVIKPTAGGSTFSVDANPSMTVAELKGQVQSKSQTPPEEQRLIYKGQVLKDERTVDSYGLQNEHILHMVRKPAQQASQGATPQQGTALPSSTADQALPDLSSLGLGGMPNVGAGGQAQQAQDYTSQLLNNPMLQGLMNNPELLRSVLTSNPVVSQLMERNPEFAQLMNNPQLLRETLQASSNPSLMREQMRNADRAMSNIESHPEGFNMLRRMYENIQEPLMNANLESTAAAGSNPFADLLGSQATGASPSATTPPSTSSAQQGTPPATSSPNTAPLPNPWAPPQTGSTASPGTGSAALPNMDALGGMGGLGGLGGMGGMPGGMDMQRLQQAMAQPGMQDTIQGLLSSPGFVDSMAAMNPQMGQLMDAHPQLREMLGNPQLMQQLTNPRNMQAMLQMQQAMQQLQGIPGMGPATGGAGAGTGGAGQQGWPAGQDLEALLGMQGGMQGGAFGGLGTGAPAVSNPEEAFATQLTQLEGMGFIDRAANIRALQVTAGDVNRAVERLLSGS
ncbi:hypothetical protein WJX73_010174 [Symbiochloris irregularis]|uniref:Ubiquilin n=1 Tax=Symbiochloris irregularis TaxID=706552 RepID=A0AAW1NZU7_9CHLO